jgi:hypothetical protein
MIKEQHQQVGGVVEAPADFRPAKISFPYLFQF